jgi:hypothetical protein
VSDGDWPVIYFKASFPARIETRAARSHIYAACRDVVNRARRHQRLGNMVEHAQDPGAKALLERDLGGSADVAEAVEIDATEYWILRAAARARIRP